MRETRFGHVLVTWTEKGVCAVLLADSPARLVDDLRREFAAASISHDEADAAECHRVVRSYGSPGGYRWGEERKRRLLPDERAGTAGLGGGRSARLDSGEVRE